jgi:hypothetical protein
MTIDGAELGQLAIAELEGLMRSLELPAREPSDAQERLPLFQDVILFRRQQSLTADSLI